MGDRFHQIVPIAKLHDAVGRMAFALDSLFREWHLRSAIFTERQRNWLRGPLRQGILGESAWNGGPAPRLSLYHHSIGTRAADRFLRWPAERRVLLYHNITPENLPGLSSEQCNDLKWGRQQLGDLIRGSDMQIGLSAYSCAELRERGAKRVIQLPYLCWDRRITAGPEHRPGPRVLVVARVVPHKRILECLHAFSCLRARFPWATLRIVGSLRGDSAYVDEVKAEVGRLKLGDSVRFDGRVSNRGLIHHYRRASVLLSLSDHEGFCVPVVEAMEAGTPIVAFAAGAVPETLGEGGWLLTDRDPVMVADALTHALTDTSLRARWDEARRRELERLGRGAFLKGLGAALSSLGLHVPGLSG